jgi:paraquat-inducible protein B
MSNKANPTLIGGFVVGAVVLATIAVLVLGSGKLFKKTTKAVCFFTGDVMGLNVGAPVKFKGVDIGSVADVRIRLPEETGNLTPQEIAKQGVRMPVIIEIDNEKVTQEGATRPLDTQRVKQLIEVGLRAQLVSQSLVTGLLLVKLDFQPDIPPTFVLPRDSKLLEIPTAPTSLQQIQAAAQDVVRRLEAIDLERLVNSATGALESIEQLAKRPALQETIDALPATVANVNTTLADLRGTLTHFDKDQGPLLQSLKGTSDTARVALQQAGVTLHSMQALIAPNAPLAVDLTATLRELAAAAHSVRLLADSLDRNPSAIVRGTEVKAR